MLFKRLLRVEDGWITSSQNFYPDSKENISEQELLSVFLESYVIENKDRKTINLLFQGEILKETKDFLCDLNSPKIIIHKPNKQNKNLIDICHLKLKMLYQEIIIFLGCKIALESLANFFK